MKYLLLLLAITVSAMQYGCDLDIEINPGVEPELIPEIDENPTTWFEVKSTRFPYYRNEPDPLKGSRACRSNPQEVGADKYFIAISDTSRLWDGDICFCYGDYPCIPTCPQTNCGKKIIIRCSPDELNCRPGYRGTEIVVMVRDACPKWHKQNIKSGHCQKGDHIDLYKDLYREMTGSYRGSNIRIQFSEAATDEPLGVRGL